MRISDWSSDVCSSDLEGLMQGHQAVVQLIDSVEVAPLPGGMPLGAEPRRHLRGGGDAAMPALRQKWHHSGVLTGKLGEIGSDGGAGPRRPGAVRRGILHPERHSGVQGKGEAVTVDFGGGRIITQKRNIRTRK